MLALLSGGTSFPFDTLAPSRMSSGCKASSIAQVADGLRSLLSSFFDANSNEVVTQRLQQAADGHSSACSIQEYVTDVIVPRTVQSLDDIALLLAEDGNNAAGVPLLSVQNLRLVYTAIEVIWQCSISTTVHRHANFVLPTTTYPSSLLIPKKTMDCLAELSSGCAVTAVFFQIECIRKVVCDETFSGLMLQRNLDRMLLTYYTLSLAHFEDSQNLNAQSAMASTQLQRLTEGPIASMIVTKLRGFTRGPAWLRDASLGTLTSILQSQGGLEIVLSGYLEGSLDSAHAAALQAHVAKLVTSPPAGADKAPYLMNIGTQALDLVLYGLFKNDKTLLRVCVLIITRLCIVAPALCTAVVLQPLFAPILPAPIVTVGSGTSVYEKYLHPASDSKIQEQVHIRNPAVVFDALTVQAAVEMLHTLLTICPLNRALLDCLTALGVDSALLHLYSSMVQHTTVTAPSNIPGLHAISTGTAATGKTSAAVDAKLHSTVESCCITYLQYMGVRGLASIEKQLFHGSWHNFGATATFVVTSNGLVEVRHLANASAATGLHIKSSSTDAGDTADTTVSDTGADLLHIYNVLPSIVTLLNKMEEMYNRKLAHQKEKSALQSASSSVTNIDSANGAPPSSSSSGAKVAASSDNSGYEYLASELFLRCLAGFLRLPCTDVGEDDADLPGTAGAGTCEGAALGKEGAQGGGSLNAPAHSAAQCGLVMMLLQEQLPLPMLLRDGLQILKLIRAFVEHYAAALQSGEHLAQSTPNESALSAKAELMSAPPAVSLHSSPSSVAPATGSTRRPLIQVISSSTDDPVGDGDEGLNAVPAPVRITSTQQAEAVADTETEDQSELIECVLGLLAGILGLGEQRRTSEEEALIRSLVAPLHVIAFRRPPRATTVTDSVEDVESAQDNIAQTASDVALMILSRSYHLSHPTAAKPASPQTTEEHSADEPFVQVLQRMRSADYLFSDSPAMRGYGTRILLQHVRRRSMLNTKESKLTESDAQSALAVLLPLLSDQESFVYLNTLTVLRELGEHQPQLVFTALLHIFAGSEVSANTPITRTVSMAYPVLPQARRAMVGEALALLLARAHRAKQSRPALHQQVVQMLPSLVQVCLNLAQQRPSQQDSAAVQANISLLDMRVTNTEAASDETDAQDSALSASLVQFPSSTEVAKQAAHEAKLEGAALAADRDILRQSAVSLLAEAVTTAGPAAYRYLDDVLDVAVGVLQMETAYDQSSRAARRSAAFLANHTISTLHSSIRPIDMLGGNGRTFDSFQRVYETLQRTAMHDKDEVAKYHASTGLFTLQDIYAEQFAALGSIDGTASVGSIDSAAMKKFRFDLR